MPRKHRLRGSKGSSKRSAKVSPISLPLQPIKCCHRIAPKERLFLEAAERGDHHSMIRCLLPPLPVNVNCTNMLGRSAIQIAVDNENVEIVELLLKQNGVKIGDALLYAIREGVFKIVEMLIDHPSITPEMLGTEWPKCKYVEEIGDSEESNDYSPDISPVILAAHCDQFEILQLLLMRGAVIDRPHQLSCSCRKCQEKVHADGLRHSLRRINTYKALASPAWISLTSPDPILTAFKLSWELEKLALRENEFKDTYLGLSDQCKKCACALLDQCRSSEEVIAVLNKDNDSDSDISDDDIQERDPGKLSLSRLKLALKFNQKEFVAHPNCQQLLTSIWYEGLPSWRKRNDFSKFVICVGLIFIMPFMAMYYWIFPLSRIGQLLRSPFMKFLYHSASFVLFLVLLTCASTEVSSIKNRERLRGPPPTELEWLICIWVTGFIWSECKQLWEEGLKAYIRQWWNWLDFIMLSLYLTCFTLRFVAYLQIESGRYGAREMDRKHWPILDPTMVSEGLFAIANVFSFARIIFLFQADQYLGPLQISLGCMLIDIAKFLFIFFLVLTSFACGMNQLYWYYNQSSDNNSQGSFYTLDGSYRTLYWSLFSLTTLKDIKIENGQDFTEMVGELLFMAYHLMGVIVLINMLIAMMSSSFQEIENHADMEWKFSRSKLWMGYFDEGSTLPPPFNIIISPKSIIYCFNFFKDLFCCTDSTIDQRKRQKSFNGNIKTKESSSTTLNNSSDQNNANSRPSYNGHVTGVGLNDIKKISEAKYQDIMRRLVSRYIHQTKKQRRQDGVNEDDLLEIKQDISSLRYEIREDRKRETLRADNRLELLRSEILSAIWNNSGDLRHRHAYNTGTGNNLHPYTYNTRNGGAGGGGEGGVGMRDAAQNGQMAQNSQSDITTNNTAPNDDMYNTVNPHINDTVSHRFENLAQFNHKPMNYTAAKVESYISHLGDGSFSSQTTDHMPPLNGMAETMTSYPQRNTTYGYNLYAKDREQRISTTSHCNDMGLSNKVLSAHDIESIKLEIVCSLKSEIRETAKEVATDLLTNTSGGMLAGLNSELYQTHLYTQL